MGFRGKIPSPRIFVNLKFFEKINLWVDAKLVIYPQAHTFWRAKIAYKTISTEISEKCQNLKMCGNTDILAKTIFLARDGAHKTFWAEISENYENMKINIFSKNDFLSRKINGDHMAQHYFPK